MAKSMHPDSKNIHNFMKNKTSKLLHR